MKPPTQLCQDALSIPVQNVDVTNPRNMVDIDSWTEQFVRDFVSDYETSTMQHLEPDIKYRTCIGVVLYLDSVQKLSSVFFENGVLRPEGFLAAHPQFDEYGNLLLAEQRLKSDDYHVKEKMKILYNHYSTANEAPHTGQFLVDTYTYLRVHMKFVEEGTPFPTIMNLHYTTGTGASLLKTLLDYCKLDMRKQFWDADNLFGNVPAGTNERNRDKIIAQRQIYSIMLELIVFDLARYGILLDAEVQPDIYQFPRLTWTLSTTTPTLCIQHYQNRWASEFAVLKEPEASGSAAQQDAVRNAWLEENAALQDDVVSWLQSIRSYFLDDETFDSTDHYQWMFFHFSRLSVLRMRVTYREQAPRFTGGLDDDPLYYLQRSFFITEALPFLAHVKCGVVKKFQQTVKTCDSYVDTLGKQLELMQKHERKLTWTNKGAFDVFNRTHRSSSTFNVPFTLHRGVCDNVWMCCKFTLKPMTNVVSDQATTTAKEQQLLNPSPFSTWQEAFQALLTPNGVVNAARNIDAITTCKYNAATNKFVLDVSVELNRVLLSDKFLGTVGMGQGKIIEALTRRNTKTTVQTSEEVDTLIFQSKDATTKVTCESELWYVSPTPSDGVVSLRQPMMSKKSMADCYFSETSTTPAPEPKRRRDFVTNAILKEKRVISELLEELKKKRGLLKNRRLLLRVVNCVDSFLREADAPRSGVAIRCSGNASEYNFQLDLARVNEYVWKEVIESERLDICNKGYLAKSHIEYCLAMSGSFNTSQYNTATTNVGIWLRTMVDDLFRRWSSFELDGVQPSEYEWNRRIASFVEALNNAVKRNKQPQRLRDLHANRAVELTSEATHTQHLQYQSSMFSHEQHPKVSRCIDDMDTMRVGVRHALEFIKKLHTTVEMRELGNTRENRGSRITNLLDIKTQSYKLLSVLETINTSITRRYARLIRSQTSFAGMMESNIDTRPDKFISYLRACVNDFHAFVSSPQLTAVLKALSNMKTLFGKSKFMKPHEIVMFKAFTWAVDFKQSIFLTSPVTDTTTEIDTSKVAITSWLQHFNAYKLVFENACMERILSRKTELIDESHVHRVNDRDDEIDWSREDAILAYFGASDPRQIENQRRRQREAMIAKENQVTAEAYTRPPVERTPASTNDSQQSQAEIESAAADAAAIAAGEIEEHKKRAADAAELRKQNQDQDGTTPNPADVITNKRKQNSGFFSEIDDIVAAKKDKSQRKRLELAKKKDDAKQKEDADKQAVLDLAQIKQNLIRMDLTCPQTLARADFDIVETDESGNCMYDSVARVWNSYRDTVDVFEKTELRKQTSQWLQSENYTAAHDNIAQSLRDSILQTTDLREVTNEFPEIINLARDDSLGASMRLLKKYGEIAGIPGHWANLYEVAALSFVTNTAICVYEWEDKNFEARGLKQKVFVGDDRPSVKKSIHILWEDYTLPPPNRGDVTHFKGLVVYQPQVFYGSRLGADETLDLLPSNSDDELVVSM